MEKDPAPEPSREAIEELLALTRERSLRGMGMESPADRPVSERLILWSRCLSAIVAVGYLVLLDAPIFRILACLLVPVSVAWFPNQMASATGRFSPLRRVTRPSAPRPLLALAWILLLFPLWIAPIAALSRWLIAK